MRALDGVDAVVHLAGPAHGRFTDAAIQEQIVRATAALVTQAERARVERFVYVSSIKAVCARTAGAPVSEDNPTLPEGAYARAKLEAETAVMALPSVRPVILRPPLVIAPNAKANFARLMRIVASGVPLPFGGIDNRRSLLSLESLIAAISSVLLQKDGPTGVFHIADRPSLSTSSLVEALSKGMGRRTIVFRGVETLLPRQLTESLDVDDSRLRDSIGDAWSRDARSAVFDCGAAYRASTQ
jgi:UDP-glucose 4-epimerase